MNQFESVKAAVPPRDAAKHYGLTVSRYGMTCCPFHRDRHPSLKLNEDYFFCFGCGASDDVIDFTARLFGISPKDAAQKLTADFGIYTKPPVQSGIPNCHAEPSQTGSGSAFVSSGSIFGIFVSGNCGIVLRSRATQFVSALPRR